MSPLCATVYDVKLVRSSLYLFKLKFVPKWYFFPLFFKISLHALLFAVLFIPKVAL